VLRRRVCNYSAEPWEVLTVMNKDELKELSRVMSEAGYKFLPRRAAQDQDLRDFYWMFVRLNERYFRKGNGFSDFLRYLFDQSYRFIPPRKPWRPRNVDRCDGY
jgi:hypothetical protein